MSTCQNNLFYFIWFLSGGLLISARNTNQNNISIALHPIQNNDYGKISKCDLNGKWYTYKFNRISKGLHATSEPMSAIYTEIL